MPQSTPNKVSYGLQNVYYATITEDATTHALTFGTPVSIPGAVNLNLEQSGEKQDFYADNRVYYAGAANAGYSGDLEIALIPESFLVSILKYTKDGAMLIENANASPAPFALLFQFEGDAAATRHVLWYCTASRPAISSQTTGENIEVKTRTLSITASARPDTHDVYAYAESDDTRYNTWFSSVPQPSSSNP